MSEPEDRARRVIGTGAALLALVLVALAAAAWRLVEAEEADAEVRGGSVAATGVKDFLGALSDEAAVEPPVVVLTEDGEQVRPSPPRPYSAAPVPSDTEAAFLVRESRLWSGSLRRAALQRALRSQDPAARLAAAAEAVRDDLRAASGTASGWALAAGDLGELVRTRDGVLVGLAAADEAARDGAMAAIGSRDDRDAASCLIALVPGAADAIRARRAALADADRLLPAFRSAGARAQRSVLLAHGDAVGAVLAGWPSLPGRTVSGGAHWCLAHVPAERVREIADRVLTPRGLRLVGGVKDWTEGTPRVPGEGRWAVVPTFAAGEARSRSTLLLAGLGTAAASAAFAFAAFARSVRREARMATLRTEFVATVSHELRTPVAVVRTSAETLAAGRAMNDADRRTLTTAIVRESERLSDLVGNVLDFARMEAGRRTYAFRETDVGALVRDVASRHAGVDVEVAPDLTRLRCDADAIGAAVTNLLDNARKFSEPEARCALLAYPRNGEVCVEVIDHGIGVPDGEKSHVFERFFRGADPRVRETRGAGIGLALVQHAAQAHGGRVEVADTPGGGATLRIVLPVAQNGDR